MESLELILLLFGIVLVSAVLDQLFSRISLPLVQIAIGAVAALVVGGPLQMNVDPELFLVLFIAPLLFDESRRVDKASLMGNLSDILSLAIGLVLVSMLAVGFLLNWLQPSIPLAAAFALGAALGPTDAVAVSALSGSVRLSKRQHALLSGEALINDASGVVSFQFAVAAAVTGAFSLMDAGQTFAVTFLGGIACGVLLAVAAMAVLKVVRGIGLESTVFHVTFELCTPFVIFLVAETMHVSGILAVVAAGLVMKLFPQRNTAAVARVNIVSGSVWEVLTFILNGVVFVLLGMELPQAILPSWEGSGDLVSLVGLVLAVTVAVVGMRFVWLLVMEAVRVRRGQKDARALGAGAPLLVRLGAQEVRDALVTTLAGPKGAVTLSIAFTLPLFLSSGEPFPWRNELLFLASGTILCTLLLANFVVPLLAPKAEDDEERKAADVAQAEIFDRVIAALRVQDDPGKALAAAIVCGQYEEQRVELASSASYREAVVRLHDEVSARQKNYLEELQETGRISEVVAKRCRATLARSQHVTRGGARRRATIAPRALFMHAKALVAHGLRSKERSGFSGDGDAGAVFSTYRELEEHAIAYLQSVGREHPASERSRIAMQLAGDHEKMLALMVQTTQQSDGSADCANDAVRESGSSHTAKLDVVRLQEQIDEMEAEALRLELGYIQDLYEGGSLSHDQASDLRERVYVLQMNLADGVG